MSQKIHNCRIEGHVYHRELNNRCVCMYCGQAKPLPLTDHLLCAVCGHGLLQQESNKDWWDLWCPFCKERRATFNKHYQVQITRI